MKSKSAFFICWLLLIGFLFSENTQAQSAINLDSSYQAILKLKDDTVKIKLLNDLGMTLEESDTVLCNKVYSESIAVSRRIKNPLYEWKSLINKGILNITHGRNIVARMYYNLAYQVALKMNNHEYMGKALSNIGNTYLIKNQYDEAMKYYLIAIKDIEKSNDLIAISNAYQNISYVFHNQHLYDNELLYCQNGLNVALQSKNINLIGRSYSHMALFYQNKDDAKNLEYSLKALQYLRHSHFKMELEVAYLNISDGMKKNGDYKNALLYCDSSLQISIPLGFSNDIGLALTIKGMIALEMKDIVASEKYTLLAKPYAKDEDSWLLWREWYLQMSNLEEAKGNYKSALSYYQTCVDYADSVNNDEIQNSNLALEAKHQTEKKQSQITQLEKEKQIQQLTFKQKTTQYYVLIGSLIAVILLVILGLRTSRQKQIIQNKKIKELEQEKQFVAVNSILQGQEAERTRMAKDLHDGLGGMLSGIKLNLSAMKGNMIIQESDANLFTKSISQLDNAIAEMRRVAHNMMPEALLKFGLNEAIQDYCDGINESNTVKLKYAQIGLTQPLEKQVEVILYRIIQELTNNVIKHADAKIILIQLSKHERGISLIVEDDGKGFNIKQIENRRGAGLQNVQSRVDYLKGNYTIESETGKGTSVTIEIPA